MASKGNSPQSHYQTQVRECGGCYVSKVKAREMLGKKADASLVVGKGWSEPFAGLNGGCRCFVCGVCEPGMGWREWFLEGGCGVQQPLCQALVRQGEDTKGKVGMSAWGPK